jgi:phospholipase A1
MRFFLSLFLFFSLLLAEPIEQMIEKAKNFEENGQIEEALFWYKKAALKNLEKLKDEPILEAIEELPKEGIAPIQRAQIYAAYLDPYEDKESKETIFQMLSGAFGLRPYKSNYIIPVSYDDKSPSNRQDIEAKFQLSLQKELGYNWLGLDESYNFGYTQVSWWQVYDDSSPFRETNYQPELFVTIPYKSNNSALKAIQFGFLHDSNGQSGPFSRSWNRIYAQAYFQLGGFFITPRVWQRLEEPKKNHPLDANGDDNPDIQDYLGYGDLSVYYPWGRNLFKGTFKNNLSRHSNKSGIELEWSFPIFNTGIFGFLQYYYGYGESLIDYAKLTHRIGLGISLSR